MFLELERTLRRSKIATKYIYIHGPVCVDTSPPDTIKVNPLRPAGGVNTDVFDSSARSEPTAFVFILPGALYFTRGHTKFIVLARTTYRPAVTNT